MSETVKKRLQESLATATKAEKAIASYMLSNLSSLPFETAASVAEKAGVSEPMIGRFCRARGYQHFKDLKADLKEDIGDKPWLIGDRLREFQRRNLKGEDHMARGLELEIAGLVHLYELAHGKEWKRVVKRLAKTPRVFVTGFQTERGVAQFFVNQLQYLRDGVQLIDVTAGNFADLLLTPAKDSCLVIYEARRYSRLAMVLARSAQEARIPTTLITDSFCDWGHELVDEMLVVRTEFNMFWDSTAQMASLSSLLINGIFNELGTSIEARMDKVAALYGRFIGHAGDPSGPET